MWFPELGGYQAGEPEEPIDEAKRRVGRDFPFVAGIYDRFRPDDFPPVNDVDRAWAAFRWTQVQLFYALEYVRRHGAGNLERARQDRHLENDMWDYHYATTALLTDALATQEKNPKRGLLRQVINVIEPEKELLAYEPVRPSSANSGSLP